MLFTTEHPPRSGQARKLWQWWTRQREQPPARLWVIRPSPAQQSAGAAHYSIEDGQNEYLVWDVDATLRMTLDAATRDPRTGQYSLA